MNNNVTINKVWYLGATYVWASMLCGPLRVHETCTTVWNGPSTASQL